MTLALMAQLDPAAAGGGGAGGRRRRRGAEEGLPQVSSEFITLEIAAPPVSGRFTTATAAPGETVSVNCTLEPASALTSKGVATLEGLPPRATAAPVAVSPGADHVEFRVKVAETTPVGDHDTLVCRIAGEVKGQEVVTRLGRGGHLKVTPPGVSARGPGGAPLSPLEALRSRERSAKPAPDVPRR
jgi:hypothetical protein